MGKTNPAHYPKPDAAAVVRLWGLDYERGAALKYIARAGTKEGESLEDDISKAIAYLALSLRARLLSDRELQAYMDEAADFANKVIRQVDDYSFANTHEEAGL